LSLCVDIQEEELKAVETGHAQLTAIKHILVADNLLEDLSCSALIEKVFAFAGSAVIVIFG